MYFSPFCIAIISLWEEKANLSAFRTFVLVLDLSVSSSSWCLGRATVCDCGIHGLFSYLFSSMEFSVLYIENSVFPT